MSLKNVLDIFRPSPAQSAGTSGNTDSNVMPPGKAHESSTVDANGVIPPQKVSDLDPNANKDPNKNPDGSVKTPLDPFKELWQPNKTDGDAVKQNPLSFDVDPQKMMEAAGKVDFTRVLNQDSVAKMLAGGEEGVKASVAAMNQVAQTVYAQSALATTKIVEHAIKTAREEFVKEIPGLLKNESVEAQLREANPMFANPAIKPIIEGLKNQLVVKFPNATSIELTKMAQDYFLGVSSAFAPKQESNKTTSRKGQMTGREDEDWEDFFKS